MGRPLRCTGSSVRHLADRQTHGDNVNTLNFPLCPRCLMPIHRLLEKASFGPDEIKALVDAFEGGIRELGIDRNDPVAVALAQSIFALAQQGERDAVLLRRRAVQAVSQPS